MTKIDHNILDSLLPRARSMKTIWKFPFTIKDMVAFDMPKGAEVLHVEVQKPANISCSTQPCLWALVDPEAEKERRLFSIFGGHPIANVERMEHVATFLDGAYVWHVFEEKKETNDAVS